MAVQAVPTKGNLMNTKKSLALAKNGYELLDRKRNILKRNDDAYRPRQCNSGEDRQCI